MDPQVVSNILGTWGYVALLLLLIATGVGSPIPEDLLLLTAGYLVFTNVFQWPTTFVVSATGVVVSDLMLYAAGRHFAWRAARWPDKRLLTPERIQRTTRWFARLGNKAIVIARLTPGTRAIVFVAAGARAVPIGSFLRHDATGAALWVPAMLALGYAFGGRVGGLDAAIEWLNGKIAWAVLVAALLMVIWLSWGQEESKL